MRVAHTLITVCAARTIRVHEWRHHMLDTSISRSDAVTGEPTLAHWHVDVPNKGCVAACGYEFGPSKPQVPSTPCPACLNALMSDVLTACPCTTTKGN